MDDAQMVELVDTPDLGSGAARCAGSSPVLGILLSCLWISSASADFEVLKYAEFPDSHIAYLVDEEGGQRVLKQMLDPSPDEQLLLVLDWLACGVGQTVHIPVNRVELISADVCFPGKTAPSLPATLHTVAPGQPVSDTELVDLVDLHQRMRKPGSMMWQRWGPLPNERKGLSRTVVRSMASHPDLARLAALDTFVGNADRSAPNLFYEASTGQFTGIDMAASFCSNLAAEAHRQLMHSFYDEMVLTREEVGALALYRTTLEKLLLLHESDSLVQKLHQGVAQSGLDPSQNRDLADRLLFHERIIRENHASCRQLVKALSEWVA